MRKPPFLLAREQILAFIPDFISVERYFDEILSAQANAWVGQQSNRGQKIFGVAVHRIMSRTA